MRGPQNRGVADTQKVVVERVRLGAERFQKSVAEELLGFGTVRAMIGQHIAQFG
jgi:hypothetical protein